MVRWLRWHCPPDTGFEIRTLAVWGRARYLSVTEAPHNTNFHTWMGKKHFCFFQTADTGNRTPNSGVKGSGANHYPRAPVRNCLLCGLPAILIKRLQRVQNAAARVIAKAGRRDHISPILPKLHWLPVEFRIKHNILLLTYRAIHGGWPRPNLHHIPLYTT